MRLTSLIRSEPFQAATRVLAVFLVLYSIACWALLKSVETTLIEDLRSRVQGETALLSQIYRDEGRRGLIEAINRLERAASDRAYGLFDERRLSLTGPISTQPDFLGFDTRDLGVLSRGRIAGRYAIWVDRIDALTLVVGRDDAVVGEARTRLIKGMALFGTLLAFSTLFLGLWAARRSQQRLDRMEHVLSDVAKGQMSARLPVGPNNDQIDRVSKRINANLAQLQRLVVNVKSSASAIAHDLKTPLSHAQIAMQEAADAVASDHRAREKVGAALAATDELGRLFETILRLSRIQTTANRSHFKETSLKQIAEKAIAFLEPLAEENDQSLTLSDKDTIIEADADMLQQAMINLVQNACTHAGAKAKIEIEVKSEAHSAVLTVKDNGPGIPDDIMKDVRTPFTRGREDRGSSGHGLGLAIVAAVAELHEAELLLENTSAGFEASLVFPSSKKPEAHSKFTQS